MRRLLLALSLSLSALACASGKGSSCQNDYDCTTSICCLICAEGPCDGNVLGLCCTGVCDADGGCPPGSSCDGGICL